MKIKKLLSILLVMLLAVSMMGASSSKTPAKVSGVKAITATDSAIGISWKSAKNAKKYEVKYKVSSAKSWKSVTTTSKKATTAAKREAIPPPLPSRPTLNLHR